MVDMRQRMKEARRYEAWEQVSWIMATIVNVNRGPRTAATSLSFFNPLRDKQPDRPTGKITATELGRILGVK